MVSFFFMTEIAPNSPKPKEMKDPKKPPLLDEDMEKSEKIIEGANDLMHLPIEVLQEELIKRNYYPKMVKKFNKNYCVALLREEIIPKMNNLSRVNTNTYISKRGLAVKQKIFSPTFNAVKKEEQSEKTNEEEEKKS